jgi:deoxycytidylate deaminase
MKLAVLAAQQGTCPRRKIGACLYDANGEILGEGHNGVNGECACPGRDVPAGAGNAACYGIHAEVRALMQATEAGHKPSEVASCYSTKAPCTNCTLMLLATGCKKIVFQVDSNETLNKEIWIDAGREWIHQPLK